MPALVCEAAGRRVVLGVRCIVGRGRSVQLRIQRATVSAEHASVYFDGRDWKVRDLGSRNGTFLRGQRMAPGEDGALQAGDELIFGGSEEPVWTLAGSHPPVPSARTAQGALVVGEPLVLWLPSPREPDACVRFQAGRWRIESAGEARFARDGDTLECESETYRLELPPEPMEVGAFSESTVDVACGANVQLRFSVSQDLEHISLDVAVGGELFPLGARAHNHSLLVLAERRLLERSQGTPEAECGWFYAQDLRRCLGLDREVLNLQLWRATQALKKAGLPAESLIERRVDSQQLRIGFSELVVENPVSPG